MILSIVVLKFRIYTTQKSTLLKVNTPTQRPISCSIPSIEMESSKTAVSALISASTNGQQFGSVVPLVFVSRPEIYNVMPKSIQLVNFPC